MAATLKMQAEEISANREFGAMGLTSLLSLELRNRLERALGRALPATLAWNYPTIAALSTHLAGEARAASAPQAGTSDRTRRGGQTACRGLGDFRC